MPTFIPPTTEGVQRFEEGDRGPQYQLFKYYKGNPDGNAVWKDQADVWHQSPYPYQGGHTSTVHDGPTTTITGPDDGLDTAKEVYLGGHVYDITADKAVELTAAGFGAYIT